MHRPEQPCLETTRVGRDYKSTSHLPQTAFAMRGDLPKREPAALQRWQSEDLYAEVRAHSAGRPLYVLPDGQSDSHSALHIRHRVNTVLKETHVKSRPIVGLDCPFLPGAACHCRNGYAPARA